MERLLRAVLPAACILVLLTALLLPWDEAVQQQGSASPAMQRSADD